MRGQLTFEYLVLSLVAIALLAISLSALLSIRENSEKTFSSLSFRSSTARLEAAINEVCAMGNGNARTVYLEESLGLENSGIGVKAVHGADSITFGAQCDVTDTRLEKGTVSVKNEEGKITFG